MPTPMSPDVQAYGQLPSAEQAEELFKQKFSSMAYNVMFAKFPDLAQQVVTFKLLEVDAQKGKGIGAFIFMQDSKPIYIPVIMSDSQLKPMDIFYFKDLNIFLPMAKEWLEEVSKMSLEELGQPSEIPSGVPRDIDIRNVVMPPFTASGRVGLASDQSDLDFHAKALFKEAENNNFDIHPRFLEFIGQAAPRVVLDGVKIAFERYPQLLQKMAHFHGSSSVLKAFKQGYARVSSQEALQTKTAALNTSGKVRVFTNSASSEELKEAFGKTAAAAYSNILRKGIAIADSRQFIEKVAVKVEHNVRLSEPGSTAGFYRLYFMDAPPEIYYVVPNPKGNSPCTVNDNDYYSFYGDTNNQHKNATTYLIINKDGKEVWCTNRVVGEHIPDESKVLNNYHWIKALIHGKARNATPTVHDYGFFLNTLENGMVQATKPFWIHSITDTKGIKKVTADYSGGTNYVIDNNTSRDKINVTQEVVMIPPGAKWVASRTGVSENDKYSVQSSIGRHSIISDPKLISHWMDEKLQTDKAASINVKKAGFEEYWVDQEPSALHFTTALEKIATNYGVSVQDAAGILLEVERGHNPFMYAIPQDKVASWWGISKIAQPGQEGPMQGQGPAQGGQQPQMSPEGGGGMPMDPSMQGMDPSMMGGMGMGMMQPAVSPMSPTDLAIAEVVDKLTQENQLRMQQLQDQMQQQQQALQQESEQNSRLVQVLQQIQTRSQQINQATGGVIPAGAEASPAVAARMLAPEPAPEQEPPPQPMMPEGNVNPEMVAQQINPQMADAAGDLGNAGVFDMAAMSMLAASPVLHDIIATYVPNLEKAVDNLGRILLTLWMQESDVKTAIGDLEYTTLEDRLRTVFKGLGELVIKINRNAVNPSQMPNQAMMNQH